MNRYAQNIITVFTGDQNKSMLYEAVSDYFKDPNVDGYLAEYFDSSIAHFSEVILRDMNLSTPIPGISLIDQVNSFNTQFMRGYLEFIRAHVLGDDEVQRYTVGDGIATSRLGPGHHAKPTANILQHWAANSGRPIQIRADSGADAGLPTFYGNSCGRDGTMTGITFCDQSHIGTQNHVEMYQNTFYKRQLNGSLADYQHTPFGVSTLDSDRRLMSRRIMRNDEAMPGSGIPRRRARLHNRYLERDITEGLRGAEKDYLLSGYDMSGLHNKVDYIQGQRSKWDKFVDVPQTNKLWYH